MEKMEMRSKDLIEANIKKLADLFPGCLVESIGKDGRISRKIDIEYLKQFLSDEIVESDEAYELDWVGKRAAISDANRTITKTLRPEKSKSVQWDTTENLYIEGDNLEVLKLLQESYLSSIKVIYIDPPYNTGSDFIYNDNFVIGTDEYERSMGVYNVNDEKLFKNTDRFFYKHRQ